MGKSSRPYTVAETRLLSEWLALRWAHRTVITRVRVGSTPPELELPDLDEADRRMLRVFCRWLDALIVDPPHLHVVEAGIIAAPGDVSQLELYCRLIPQTPDLRQYHNLKVRGRLLYAVPDPVVTDMARERGFAVETFTPPWVIGYLKTLRPRSRTPPL